MIEFDTWTNDHPRTMQVQWYRGDTLLEDQTYTVDSSQYFCDTQVQAYNKIVITIGNMTKASRHLKIYNISDGISRQFYNDELENVEIIEEITNNNKALNINEATLTILPQNNTGVLFQRTLPVTLYRNSALFGKFFINTSTSNTQKTLYNIKISDYIQILESQSFLGGIYSNKTVSSLIAEILDDIPYTLDATIGAYTLTGYLPILSKRDALQEVAFAINAYIDTSRNDEINIKPLPTTVSRSIQPSEILYIQTTQKNIVTKIEVETEALTQKVVDAEEIYTGTINGYETIIFDSPKYSLAITGGTIVSSNINYAIISGNGAVTLTGKNYEIYTNVQSKTNPFAVSTDIENIEKYNTTLICNNINIIDKLKFVEFTIRTSFKMADTKIGDMIKLQDERCRVMQLSYDLKQTNIYAEAELDKYYEDDTYYIAAENGEYIMTENEEILEVE